MHILTGKPKLEDYTLPKAIFLAQLCTVEPLLEDCPNGHKNVVSQDRWSLVTGSITLKYRTCPEYLVFQGRWSHYSGLSRQVSLYMYKHQCEHFSDAQLFSFYSVPFSALLEMLRMRLYLLVFSGAVVMRILIAQQVADEE